MYLWMLQISLTKWCVHVHPDLIRCPNFGRCRADLLFLAVACYLDSQVARVLGQCTCWFADRELHEERQVYKLHHIKLMVILLWSTYFRMRTYVDVRATPCVHSSDCASQGPCPCKFMYILFFRTTHGRLSPHPASGIAWLLATTRGFCRYLGFRRSSKPSQFKPMGSVVHIEEIIGHPLPPQ